jgi:hypothetical protein
VAFGLVGGICVTGTSAVVALISLRRIEELAGLKDRVRAFGGAAALAMLVLA